MTEFVAGDRVTHAPSGRAGTIARYRGATWPGPRLQLVDFDGAAAGEYVFTSDLFNLTEAIAGQQKESAEPAPALITGVPEPRYRVGERVAAPDGRGWVIERRFVTAGGAWEYRMIYPLRETLNHFGPWIPEPHILPLPPRPYDTFVRDGTAAADEAESGHDNAHYPYTEYAHLATEISAGAAHLAEANDRMRDALDRMTRRFDIETLESLEQAIAYAGRCRAQAAREKREISYVVVLNAIVAHPEPQEPSYAFGVASFEWDGSFTFIDSDDGEKEE